MSVTAAVLLAALLLGHNLGDFTPLATPRMLGAKSEGRPIGPIAAHAAVHGLLAGLALVGIIYGALVAMVQADVKRLVAFSSVSHLGFVVLPAGPGKRFEQRHGRRSLEDRR